MNKKIIIVQIVDGFSDVNFGVWNTSLQMANYAKQLDIENYVVGPILSKEDQFSANEMNLQVVNLGLLNALKILLRKGYSKKIIISHGLWRRPTVFSFFSRLLIKEIFWIATPHGMLDKHVLNTKRLKKKLYWNFFEYRMLKLADSYRSVSNTETNILKRYSFNKIYQIENGADLAIEIDSVKEFKNIFSFMGRLNAKKGLEFLLKAWSQMDTRFLEENQLNIVGPDDGLLSVVEQYTSKYHSIEYCGALYGDDKISFLMKSNYFLLPSYSEGYPSSVVEAMQCGCVPVVTKECNIDEIFEHGLGFTHSHDIDGYKSLLSRLSRLDSSSYLKLSVRARSYANLNMTVEKKHEKFINLILNDL